MSHTYGLILASHPTSITRAVLGSDGSVTVQRLRVDQEVTVEADAFAVLQSAMQEEIPADAILQMLLATTIPEGC